MPMFLTRWEIDIEADSPREAAEKARTFQRAGTWVGVFDVTDEHGETKRVDLDEDDEEEV